MMSKTMKHLWTLIDKNLNKTQENLNVFEKEHHYISRVLRLKPGDSLSITNGEGLLATGLIKRIDKKQSEIEIFEIKDSLKKELQVELWQALIKKNPLEDLVSNISELGVDNIKIFKSLVSQSKSEANIEKLQSLCYESLRVNKSPWLCKVESKKTLKELINEERNQHKEKIVILCDELLSAEQSSLSIYKILEKALLPDIRKIILVVGCESGLDIKEKFLLTQSLNAFHATLGTCILRAPNAAFAAASSVISYISK